MKVEYRIHNPEWETTAYYYAKEYSPYHTLVTQEEYIRDKMEKSGIAEELVIVGEIVHCDYDKFECVVLSEDGTYHKSSLDQVKVIKKEEDEHN
jgi:hypothetical protein